MIFWLKKTKLFCSQVLSEIFFKKVCISINHIIKDNKFNDITFNFYNEGNI